MVTIDKAVEIAQENLGKVMPDFLSLHPSVEEFGLSKDGEEWVITFRAKNPDPAETPHGMGSVFMPFVEKVVRIAISNGTLLSVRNPSYDF
jgi:hypothetical protein